MRLERDEVAVLVAAVVWAAVNIAAWMLLGACAHPAVAGSAGPAPSEHLLACVCRTDECRERRRDEVQATVDTLLDVTAEAGAPPVVAAVLAATLCGESGAQARPRGHNDAGTSAGWFQFKTRGGHAAAFAREHGRELDPYDLREAATWYVARMQASKARLSGVCGDVADPWMVAAARVAAGPWAVAPQPRACAWVQAPTQGQALSLPEWVCVPAVAGVQQCAPRTYGRWARQWLARSPAQWAAREAGGGGS